MKSKTESIALIDPSKTYLGSFVQKVLTETTLDDRYSPIELKKGDVVLYNSGLKRRPCVIICVKSEYVLAIPLTSGENIHNLLPSSSRFFGTGFFCNHFEIIEKDFAIKSFVGVYDNPKLLKKAIMEIKMFTLRHI